MASICGKVPSCDHSLIQTTNHASRERPSLLLKDYLRDDLSSCSSSGFKSFPRRQCCTTVGFLLQEKDLQLQRKRRNTVLLPRRRGPTPSSSTISALQRASEAVIKTIKSLPLSQKSAKVKTKKAAKPGLLSRSLSRKLLSRSFWRKAAKEEGTELGAPRCRRSFRELLMQERDHKPTSSLNEDTIFTAPNITTVSSGCGSINSWGESEFTFSSSAVSSDSSTENDLVIEGTKDHHKIIEGVTTTDWSNEKEQFSPVSVLDCPFEDEEKMMSHFSSTGAEHKHMQKRRHFQSAASLEPVDLEKRIACSELEDEPHSHSTKQCSVSVPIMCTQNGNNNIEEDNARDLLNMVKRSIPSNCLIVKAENLLFDYFKQSIRENNDFEFDHSKKVQLCKVAEDWIQGKPQELYLGLEVQEGRRVHISEMDNCGEWKNNNCDQEKQQLALQLENEVFTSLVNELVLDLTT